MVPVPLSRNPQSSRLLYILASLGTQYAPRIARRAFGDNSEGLDDTLVSLTTREAAREHDTTFIVFACLIPILVLMSGLFAGLTLGYMSLDETQLHVLSISGTPEQRKYADKIMPVRKNGHLLLVTLLLANMIVNESLPVIADPVLGGGIQGVVVSTVLIVIFAEIIPQSLFTRHGLYLGAKMATFTQFLIYFMGIIAWPVAKLLEFVLGAHHGIIYRRAELKELIAMHSSQRIHGGDLKTDTVTIIGATLDLQEKVVRQAMTPIEDVFMLSIDSKLDYELLKKICRTGHSRIPVYEEIELPVRAVLDPEQLEKNDTRTVKVKKIIGILLVKQCVLLDPKDATPLRKIPLNKVPFVPNNEPLLGILDKFQEGRSHMAIVSRFSVEKAASVKKAVKRGLTERIRAHVGMGDTDSDTDTSDEEKTFNNSGPSQKKKMRRKLLDTLRQKDKDSGDDNSTTEGGETTVGETATGPEAVDILAEPYDVSHVGDSVSLTKPETSTHETEKEKVVDGEAKAEGTKKEAKRSSKIMNFQLTGLLSTGLTSIAMQEQSTPADAVLGKKNAAEFLQGFDPAVMPMGIITLEDVLEELIGEEIYDEFDPQGANGDPYEVPPPVHVHEVDGAISNSAAPHSRSASVTRPESVTGSKTSGLKSLGFFRTKSAPPVPREPTAADSDAGTANAVRFADGGVAGKPESGGSGPTLQMPRPVKGSRNPPSVILEQHSSVSSQESGVNDALKHDVPTSLPSAIPPDMHQQSPSPPSASAVPPHLSNAAAATNRSGSPVPPLEAILLDRKRRLAAASSGGSVSGTSTPVASQVGVTVPAPKDFAVPGVTISPPTSGASSPAPGTASAAPSLRGGVAGSGTGTGTGGGKGTKFKSSPLGGMERSGVVVAEQVGAAYAPNPAAVETKNEEKKE